MPPTTQPILCCVGQRVAGKPTQFLMERAFTHESLDWRAITVEVEPDQFEVAVAGMQAMKFQAIRFFPSLQPLALKLLAASDPSSSFVGGVTSACLSESGWQPWHNLGLAIRDWAGKRVDFHSTVCWLHGDSPYCRSFLAGLVGQPPPKAIIWTCAPQPIPAEMLKFGDDEQPVRLQPATSLDDADSHAMLSELDSSKMEGWNQSLLLVGAGHEDLLQSSDLMSRVTRWLIVGTDAAAKGLVNLNLSNCSMLNELDQVAECEAYDFQRWTGHAIDVNLLREAYDEYRDF